MLSVSDVNRSSYIVNRYSRLAVRAGACLSCGGTDKWNIFRGLNQRKMGFHLLAYPLCRSQTEMIACRSSSRCLFLSHSHWTWPLNPAEVTKREFISRVLQKRIQGHWYKHNHTPYIMDSDFRMMIGGFALHKQRRHILKVRLKEELLTHVQPQTFCFKATKSHHILCVNIRRLCHSETVLIFLKHSHHPLSKTYYLSWRPHFLQLCLM